jgi:uncharacterized protein (TIGR00299 family) protein
MFLAAFADVGAPFETIRDAVLTIPELSGVRAELQKVTRGVFAATRIEVTCPEAHHHRSFSKIRSIIEESKLSERVKIGAIATFEHLADAEAKVHGTDREDVHFHEVGALDAMFDIIAAHVAVESLGNPRCVTRPVTVGTGATTCQHGEIPIPAPASIELLTGHRVRFSDRNEELVTPTGAAIIASVFKPVGADAFFVPDRVGYGAGTRENDGLPNVLRIMAGTIEESPVRVCIVTSTIDDMNPEIYGHLMDRLFAEGCLDVYYNPVMMKKNRPGVEVTIITEERDVYRIAEFLMANTTTLGVRIDREERVELRRRKASIETPYGTVTVKVAERPGGVETMSPEFESCRTAAESAGVPLMDVYEAAKRAWEKR